MVTLGKNVNLNVVCSKKWPFKKKLMSLDSPEKMKIFNSVCVGPSAIIIIKKLVFIIFIRLNALVYFTDSESSLNAILFKSLILI